MCTPAGERFVPDARLDGQPESGFKSRLLGAVRRAGAESDGPLIVVGTDTPGLDATVLRDVLATLRRDPDTVVLGPAADGGIYLLAAARPLVGELAETDWRSRRTLSSLRAALRRAGRRVRLLTVRGDLDTRGDLERWISRWAAGLAAAHRKNLICSIALSLARLTVGVMLPDSTRAWTAAPAGTRSEKRSARMGCPPPPGASTT